MGFDPINEPVRPWLLTAKTGAHRGESRTYEQTQLTIDGEAQLFAVANRAVGALQQSDFPFDKLEMLIGFKSTDEIDWGLVAELLGDAAGIAPAFLAQTAATFLGIFPTDEDGRRNPEYSDEVSFIRSSIGIAEIVDMLETFVAQNDIERLRRPLQKAWTTVIQFGKGRARPVPPSLEPSTSSSQPGTDQPAKSSGATRGRRSTRT